MNKALSLICLALFAVASVHSLPKIDSDMSMQQLMAQVKNQIPADSSEEATALLNKLSTMVEDLDIDLKDFSGEVESETGEIGPNFNSKQFLNMIKRVSHASWEKRCKKVSGHDGEYAKVMEAKNQFETCFEAWPGTEDLMESYNKTAQTGDYKLMLKSVCKHRSGFFACTDNYISAISGCYFPSEMEYVHKVDRINKHLLDLVCSNDDSNFAIFDAEGEGMKCVQQSFNEIKTCANKAVYAVTERLLEKWIENEHFKFEMEPEDCTAFDEVKTCFVSSVENCTNPKVKDMFASVFQIFRDETKC